MIPHRLRRFFPARMRERPPTVAVVRLYGVIAMQAGPMRSSLNLAALTEPIERAFKMKGVKAVALTINSPGGSPVQSALIHDRIRALADEKKIPVYAFAEDVAASGGYWIACAGDEIYANDSSIVGSIGVIAAGFGFHQAIEKLGVERRLHTAGERKSFWDPFLPEREEDVRRLHGLQDELHGHFIEHVKRRRGGRLKGTEAQLFSGEFYTGRKALELGLIDAVGEMRGVMQDKYGTKVRLKAITPSRSWLQRRLGIEGDGLLNGFADALIAAVERRTFWSRYGI